MGMLIPTTWKKIMNTLVIHREKVIMIVLTMTLSISSVSTLFNTYIILTKALSRSKAMSNSADLIFYTSPFQKLSSTDLNKINGIKQIDSRFITHVRSKIGGTTRYKNMTLIAIPSVKEMKVNLLKQVQSQLHQKDILLEQSSSYNKQLILNKKVSILLPDGQTTKLTYRGTVYDFNQVPSKFTGDQYGYVTLATLNQLGITPHFNEVLIKLNKKGHNVSQDKLISSIKLHLKQQGIHVYRFSRPEEVLKQRGKILKTVLVLLVILGSLSLIFGSLLIINAMTGMMSYERQDIGIMKSIGASRLQIIKLYGDMTFILAILSICLTIPISWGVSFLFSHFLSTQLNIRIVSFHLSHIVMFFDIIMSLVLPILSSLKPVYSTSKLTVIEAMNTLLTNKNTWTNTLFHKSRWISRPFLLSIRHTFQKKGQLFLTIMTLTLGGTIILSVFSLQSSIKQTLADISNYWNYNIKIDLQSSQPSKQLLTMTSQIKGVTHAEGWVVRNTVYKTDRSINKNALLIALPSKTHMILPKPLKGSWLHRNNQQKSGVVVNEDLIEQTKQLHYGDLITLTFGAHKETRHIIGIVHSQLMGPIIYMKKNDYDHTVGRSHGINQIMVQTKHMNHAKEINMQTRLTDLYIKKKIGISSTATKSDMENRPKQMIRVIDYSLLIMGLIIIIVDILNLSTTMSIKVFDRRREIGIMQTIGASPRAITFLFISEALLLSLISWGISVLISIPLSFELVKIVGTTLLGYPFNYSLSYNGLYLWFLISIFIPIIASYFPIKQATEMTISHIIHYE